MNPPPPATAPAKPNRKNFHRGVVFGTLLGIALQVGGYLLMAGAGTAMGLVLFGLVPFVSCFAVAAVVRGRRRVLACCLTAGLTTLSILLFTGWEGIVCCVMASPLLAAAGAVGAVMGYQVRGRLIDQLPDPDKATLLLLLLCPLFLAASDRVERPHRSVQQREDFTTETTVATGPERTWALIARMDHLDGPRPFLLRVGLPVSTRCELDRPAVGGHRVCYFDRGIIEQEVTDWRPPFNLGVRITGSTLPGRHWLTFLDADYEFSPAGLGTRVVRRTAIGTRLYPRWYWRPLERWGVESEHEFVFSNIKRWAGAVTGSPTNAPAKP